MSRNRKRIKTSLTVSVKVYLIIWVCRLLHHPLFTYKNFLLSKRKLDQKYVHRECIAMPVAMSYLKQASFPAKIPSSSVRRPDVHWIIPLLIWIKSWFCFIIFKLLKIGTSLTSWSLYSFHFKILWEPNHLRSCLRHTISSSLIFDFRGNKFLEVRDWDYNAKILLLEKKIIFSEINLIIRNGLTRTLVKGSRRFNIYTMLTRNIDKMKAKVLNCKF